MTMAYGKAQSGFPTHSSKFDFQVSHQENPTMLQSSTHDWSDGSGWIKMSVFTRVYVCVKAKLTLLVYFWFYFLYIFSNGSGCAKILPFCVKATKKLKKYLEDGNLIQKLKHPRVVSGEVKQ